MFKQWFLETLEKIWYRRCLYKKPLYWGKRFFGEWLPNAQGEDVVAGVRTPHPIIDEKNSNKSLSVAMPKAFEDLKDVRKRLENHFDDMQDIEFTIQENKLWMLQTRRVKELVSLL